MMYFSQSNNKRYLYKLIAGDCIVVHKDYTQLYMILVGVLNVSKVFTNQELYAISLISDGHIFAPSFSNDYANNYYYELKALNTTYVVSLTTKHSCLFNLIKKDISKIKAYKNCSLTEILIHKSTKYRLIQLLLILSESFGIVESNKIIIPLNLSYKTLGIMIGSNSGSVGKIFRILNQNRITQHRRNWINIYSLKGLIFFRSNAI